MTITIEQIKNLWHDGGTINRGDDYDVIKQADVFALVENGEINTDDNGTPLDSEWQILAEALSDAPTDGPRQRALDAVEDAAATLASAERDRNAAIRAAIEAGASVISIAQAADLSRARIYQIRDGRR